MKSWKRVFLVVVLPEPLFLASCSRAKVLPDGQRWWSHVASLASDKLEGRQTGSAGFGVALFRFRLEGAEHISPGNRSGGSRHRRGGHAATARRSARVSRPRRLARPTGLPRSSQTQVSEVFVLAELTPNEGDLSVKHLGGVRRPAPSAGSCLGRGQESLPLPVLPGNRDMVRVHTDHIPIQETRGEQSPARKPGQRNLDLPQEGHP
jgi:hypothetical protein